MKQWFHSRDSFSFLSVRCWSVHQVDCDGGSGVNNSHWLITIKTSLSLGRKSPAALSLSVHRWSGKCLRSWWGWPALDELIGPPLPLRSERNESNSLFVVGSDHLRGNLSEKRSDCLFHLDCPFAGDICRMQGRISDQIDLAKFLIALPIRLPMKWFDVWPSVLLLSVNLPEKKTRSLLDDAFAPCTFSSQIAPEGICPDLCSEGVFDDERRLTSIPIRPEFFLQPLKISRRIQSEEISQDLIGWVKTCLDGSLISGWAEALRWEKSVGDGRECLFLILRPSRHGSKASMIPCGICRLSSGLFHSLDWRWRWGWFGMSLFFSSTRRRRTFGYERCVCVPTRPHRASWNRVKDGLTDQTSSCRSILLLCRFWKRLAHSTEEETSPMLDNACHSCRERRFPQWRISPKNFLLDVALQSSIVNGWKCQPCSFIPICSSLTLILVKIVPILYIASVSLSLLRHCHSLARWCLHFSFWSIRMILRLFRHRRSIGDEKSIEHRYQNRHHSLPVPRSIRCFDEEFLLNSSIEQSPFDQTNNDVHDRVVRHPTFGPVVKSLRWWTEGSWRERRTERMRRESEGHWERERRVAKGQLKWWSRGKKRRTSSIDRARQTILIPIPMRSKMFTLTSICWSPPPRSPCQRCSAETKSLLLSRRFMSNSACPAEQREREIWRDFLFVFVFLFPWPMCQLFPHHHWRRRWFLFHHCASHPWSPLFPSDQWTRSSDSMGKVSKGTRERERWTRLISLFLVLPSMKPMFIDVSMLSFDR